MRYEVETKALINAYYWVEADNEEEAINKADGLFLKDSDVFRNLKVRDFDSNVIGNEDDDMHQDAVYARRYHRSERDRR